MQARAKCGYRFWLFRSSKVSFYQRAVLFFCAMSISCGRCGTFRTFWGRKLRFAWRVAGYRALFHPHGRDGTFCACYNIGKHWSKWEVVLEVFLCGRHSIWWTLTMLWKGWKSLFVAGAALCRPRQKSGWELGKTSFLTFLMLIYRGARNVLWKSNIVLAQPSRDFVRVRSHSLWHGANFDMARATFSAVCACPIALVVARCWFQLIPLNSGKEMRELCITILPGFHGAVLEVRGIWRSWLRSCRGPCEKMLTLWRYWWNLVRGPCMILYTGPYEKIVWRSCWHPLRGPCVILHRSLKEDLVEILVKSFLRASCMILYRPLSEDLVEILVKSSRRGPCHMKILQMPCIN